MENTEIIERVEGTQRIYELSGWRLAVELEGADEEPRIRDVDAAERLGFNEPRMIRKLIERIWPEIKGSDVRGAVPRTSGIPAPDVRSTVSRTSMPRGGERETTVNEYWLTQAQLLRVIARSKTPPAEAILDDMIRVYMAVRLHRLTSPPAPPSAYDPNESFQRAFRMWRQKVRAEGDTRPNEELIAHYRAHVYKPRGPYKRPLSENPAAIRKRRQRELDRANPQRVEAREIAAEVMHGLVEPVTANDQGEVLRRRLDRVLDLLADNTYSEDQNATPQAIAMLIRALMSPGARTHESFWCAKAALDLTASLSAELRLGIAHDHYTDNRQPDPETDEWLAWTHARRHLRRSLRAHADALVLLAERLEQIL